MRKFSRRNLAGRNLHTVASARDLGAPNRYRSTVARAARSTSELRTDIGSTVARAVDTQSLAQAGLLGLKFASVDPAGVAWTCHLRETEVLRPTGPYGAPGLRTPMIARSVVGSLRAILNRAASFDDFV